jgi:hypothetical protein
VTSARLARARVPADLVSNPDTFAVQAARERVI